MSIEQFVRYKQQLRKATEDFVSFANFLDDDSLEVTAARVADRMEAEESHAEAKFKLYFLAMLMELRQCGEIRQSTSSRKLRKYTTDTKRVENERKRLENERLWREWEEKYNAWEREEGFWALVTGRTKKKPPVRPPQHPIEYSSGPNKEELISQVADFPIVTQIDPPTDKTPEECSPTKQEIKGFLEA